MLTYINVSAVQAGLDPEFSFYLVAIVNAAGAFGRILAGYLGDKFGRYHVKIKYSLSEPPLLGAINVMTPFVVVCGVMTFIWPFLDSKAGYIAVSVIYG